MNHPLLYEINTRCWLRELSDRLGRKITLADVPEEELSGWRRLGFTHIWLMGAWTTGPRARAFARREPHLRRLYDTVLPGWRPADVGGSPYAIAEYQVPRALGGESGLRALRQRMHAHGLKLVLDFVPNHVGFDHPWTATQPDLFVQSPVEVEGTFAAETVTGVRWLAHGRDPHFAPWADTAQLDYRRAATRVAMRDVLLSIAARCDGVRCDMAMLVLSDVFERTWARFPHAGPTPQTEFWTEAIGAVRQTWPEFLFLAEVYWGLEGRLQALGFDYTYDKQLYDDLIWGNGVWAQRRLLESPPGFVAASAHFLENHDERRVAEALSLPAHRAAALAVLGLPGLRLLHEGQLTGARVQVPVHLTRRPLEPPQAEVQQMYERLLQALPAAGVGQGEATLLTPRAAWPDNPSGQNFLLVQWRARPDEFALVAVNLAPHPSQCYAPVTIPHLGERNWEMADQLGPERWERFGSDLAAQGVYLALPAHGAQLFQFRPLS